MSSVSLPESSARAVAVYCGSLSGTQQAYTNAAVSLGTAMAKQNRRLVYGGGVNGIMGAVSKAVLQNNGKVTGVTPNAIVAGETLQDHEGLTDEQRGNTERIVVKSMHERKVNMAARVGGFVGLPGGFGTFEEILEVTTWTQIGIHVKPVVLVNVRGFYEPLRQLIKKAMDEGFIASVNQHIITFVDGPASFEEHDDFDWGNAALDALDGWKWQGEAQFNWSEPGASEAEKLRST